jgi:hypothetical protein
LVVEVRASLILLLRMLPLEGTTHWRHYPDISVGTKNLRKVYTYFVLVENVQT